MYIEQFSSANERESGEERRSRLSVNNLLRHLSSEWEGFRYKKINHSRTTQFTVRLPCTQNTSHEFILPCLTLRKVRFTTALRIFHPKRGTLRKVSPAFKFKYLSSRMRAPHQDRIASAWKTISKSDTCCYPRLLSIIVKAHIALQASCKRQIFKE